MFENFKQRRALARRIKALDTTIRLRELELTMLRQRYTHLVAEQLGLR